MPTSEQAATTWLQRLPSPVAIFVLALGGALLAVTVSKGVQDADYFWHVTAGQLIAETGSVPSTDPFSFTWQGQPWTPHEWLSEFLIYQLTQALGQSGALVVFGLVSAAIAVVMVAMVTRLGVGLRALVPPAALMGLVMAPYLTLRPQALSWLLIAGLIWFLAELRPERAARSLLLIPAFILWANLHGLYVIGLGIVAVYLIFTLLGRTAMRPAWRWVAVAAAGCVVAGMATPAGPVGLLYPLRYVEGGDWGLAHIQEWQSPDFHAPAHWPFLALIVAAGLNGGRNTPGWLVALSWIGIVLGLVALRNVPIAAVLTFPTLALGIDDRLRARLARRSARPMPPSVALGRRVLELATAAFVALAALIIFAPHGLGEGGERKVAAKYPVEAVDWLEANHPATNVLAEYGWGGYVIHELYPLGGRVFVDGRNDMYDQQILEDYDAIKAAAPGWEDLAASYGVEALLLQPTAAVTRGPAASAGWCEAYSDGQQILLLRSCPPG
jgi:hypothetical protein